MAISSPYSRSRERSTSSSSTSMTTSGRALSMAEISRPAAAIRSGVSLIEIALVALMGEICRMSTTTRSRSIDFLDVGVAQVERPDDRFLVLAALGGGVGDDRDGARGGDPVERVRARGHRRERVLQRRLAQVDGDRRIAEPRVEDQLMSANRPSAMNTIRLLALLNTSEPGSLTPVGSSSPGAARSRDRSMRSSSSVFPFARDRQLGAELLARVPERRVDVASDRVQLGRELELDQRVLVAFRGGQPPAAQCVPATRGSARDRAPAGGAVVGLARTALVYSTTARS